MYSEYVHVLYIYEIRIFKVFFEICKPYYLTNYYLSVNKMSLLFTDVSVLVSSRGVSETRLKRHERKGGDRVCQVGDDETILCIRGKERKGKGARMLLCLQPRDGETNYFSKW